VNKNILNIKHSTLDFLEQSFRFWFIDHDHIRCPFPKALHHKIKENTSKIFLDLLSELNEKESEEMNDNMLVEMFEAILFNEAYKLTEDEDIKLTITYPFLPRLGDKVNDIVHGEGKIISRKELITKENKKLFQLGISSDKSGHIWNTEFILPA
jgi:hypothetical protein